MYKPFFNISGPFMATLFVHSTELTGMRNISDYISRIRPDFETLGGANPFNIKKESFNLINYTLP